MVTVYKYLSILSETLLSVVVHHYDTITNRTDYTEHCRQWTAKWSEVGTEGYSTTESLEGLTFG